MTPATTEPGTSGDAGHDARRRAAKGASSVALSRLGNVVDVISQPIYTWLFGLPTYGLYQVLWSLVNIGENVFDLGTTSALQRILPRETESEIRAAVVRSALLLGILPNVAVALAASLAAPWIAPLINAAPADLPRLVLGIRLFAWALPLWATVEVATSAVRACHAFGPEVRLRLMWEQLARLVAAFVFWLLGFGLIGLLLAHLVSLTITAIMALRLLHRYVPLGTVARVRAPRTMLHDMAMSGLSALPSNILARVFSDVATIIANLLAPGAAGAKAAGLYAIARKISSVPQIVRQTFSYVLGPIAAASARGDRTTIQGLYDFAVRLSLLLALPTCAALIAAGPALLGLFKDADGALPILAILTVSRGVEAAVGPASAIQQVIGKRRLPVYNSLVALIFSAVVLIAAEPFVPGAAIALAVATGQVVVVWLSIGQLQRQEGLRMFAPPFARTLLIALAICAGIALVATAAGHFSLKLQGLAGFLAWAGLVWFGARLGLTVSDKAALGKAGRKLRL
jgi:O-antigen/teichoic acid export membrane protein